MRRNRIILTPDRATPTEGVIAAGQNPLPGQIVQADATVPLQGGRMTWKLFTPASGAKPSGPLIVLTEDLMQGRTAQTAYNAGERAQGAIMRQGCEFNGLYHGAAVAADVNVAVATATGKFFTAAGTEAVIPAKTLEPCAAVNTDTLTWMQFSGY